MRLRRNIDSLSGAELARYALAIERMLALKDDHGYLAYASVPGMPPPLYTQNNSEFFLAWNRAMLASFERALAQIDPEVTVPWWDWAQSESTETTIPRAFTDERIAGKENPLRSVKLPADVVVIDGQPTTIRDPQPPEALPKAQEIERTLEVASFEMFSERLEDLHNRAHLCAGGTMAQVSLAAYDPLYWSLQANVDRIWRMWQLRNPTPSLTATFKLKKLAPFGVSVGDMLDAEILGYDYDLGGGLAAIVAGATGASSDRPSSDGGFGFDAYAEAFATLIASPLTEPPLTIGIYGSWGVGKSSLLEQIAARLDKRSAAQAELRRAMARAAPRWQRQRWPFSGPRRTGLQTAAGGRDPHTVHVVKFNAWDYNANELVWPALVRKTMNCLEQRAPQPWWDKYGHRLRRNIARDWQRQKGRVMVTVVAAIAAIAFVAVSKVHLDTASVSAVVIALGGAGLLSAVGRAVSSPVSRWLGTMLEDTRYGNQTDVMKQIRDDLDGLAERLGEETIMLIVIDDLDRCDPAKAVEVLQAVNLLLSFPSFVVCIGVDARILTAAIEAHYRGLLGDAGASGYEYLDKIIQVPFRIPDPTAEDLDDFLAREVSVQPILTPPAVSADSYGKQQTTRPGVLTDDPDVRHQSTLRFVDSATKQPKHTGDLLEPPFLQDELQAFVDIARYLRRNPRHIKRLINTYRLVRTLAQQASEQTVLAHRVTVIRWLAISAQWPYSSYVMTRNFEQLRESDQLGEAWSEGSLKRFYERSESMIDTAIQGRLDDEPDRLCELLADTGIGLSAAHFQVIQRYTINFNPAVAELPIARALVAGAEQPIAGAEQPAAEQLP